VTTAGIAWEKFTETFGEAIAVHWKHGDRDAIVKLIRRSRELLDDYRDELPRGSTLGAQVLRQVAENFAYQLELMEIELGITRH
jgi:hypothetical protein